MKVSGRARLILFTLFMLGTISPSWGWVRGGFGWRGGGGWGWHGGARLWIGAPGPWWYYDDPYYAYDPYPYDAPYYYPGPYVAAQPYYSSQPARTSIPDTSHYDLKSLTTQAARRRAYLKFQYDDGDIGRDQYDAEIRQVADVEKQARAEAEANGGYLTADQENDLLQELEGKNPEPRPAPSVSRPTEPSSEPSGVYASGHDMTEVNDLLLELRALLDQKSKDGEITKAQRDGEKSYLSRVEQQIRTEANANGGHLTDEQQDRWVQELHRAYYSINHNLITR